MESHVAPAQIRAALNRARTTQLFVRLYLDVVEQTLAHRQQHAHAREALDNQHQECACQSVFRNGRAFLLARDCGAIATNDLGTKKAQTRD
jgi:hypothetical protein